MDNPVGILYDKTNLNFGDRAIGLAMKQVLAQNGIPCVDLPNRDVLSGFKTSTVIVGGGQVIRKLHGPNETFYDIFRVPGKNILNSCGTTPNADQLDYLKDYRYVTVRSQMDYDIIKTIRPDAQIAPCSALALNAQQTKPPEIPEGSILLIHVFLPITPDITGLANSLDKALPYKKVLVCFTPHYTKYLDQLEIITGWPRIREDDPAKLVALIEHPRVVGTISSSLHATLFTYRAGKPFLVYPSDPKMPAFLSERGMLPRLWTADMTPEEVARRFFLNQQQISTEWRKDRQKLDQHLTQLITHCRFSLKESK